MPTQFTNIRGLPYPQGVDPVSVPAHIQALAVALDKAAFFDSGLRSARPSAAMRRGDRYYATDEGIEYIYTGSAWVTVGNAVGAPPIGSSMVWTADGDPPFVSGQGLWVCEDGRTLSRTTYSDLATRYGAIGATAGRYDTLHGVAAPAAGLFRIRDTRGVFQLGAENYGTAQAGVDRLPNTGPTTGITVGAVVGEERHLLVAAESGVNGSGVAASAGAHSHGGQVSINRQGVVGTGGGPDGSVALMGDLAGSPTFTQSMTTAGAHTHPLTARAADTAHNNIPPAVASATIVRIA